MNAQVAAVDNAALQGFLLRRIPPTSEWKLRAEAPGELHPPSCTTYTYYEAERPTINFTHAPESHGCEAVELHIRITDNL
jgi:hypothetical protein